MLPFINKPNHDCYIHYSYKDMKYYLMVPFTNIELKDSLYKRTNKIITTTKVKYTKPSVGVDPGSRKFMTCYTTCGKSIILGENCNEIIFKKLKELDVIISLLSEKSITGKKRKRLKKRIRLIRKYISNLKTDLHNKVAHFLSTNFSNIIIPCLDVTNIVSKKKRILKTKECRKLLSLCHGEFYKKLENKCKEYGSVLIKTKEEYTLKTCTFCGNINKTLKGSKIYECEKCDSLIDRDINGARNIMLKNLSIFYL